jgi:hypothetical protein
MKLDQIYTFYVNGVEPDEGIGSSIFFGFVSSIGFATEGKDPIALPSSVNT